MSRRNFKQVITVQGECDKSATKDKKTFLAKINAIDLLNYVSVSTEKPTNLCAYEDSLGDNTIDKTITTINLSLSKCCINYYDDFDTLSFEPSHILITKGSDCLSSLLNIIQFTPELPEDDEVHIMSERDIFMTRIQSLARKIVLTVIFTFDESE
jgi:hypothetical protein